MKIWMSVTNSFHTIIVYRQICVLSTQLIPCHNCSIMTCFGQRCPHSDNLSVACYCCITWTPRPVTGNYSCGTAFRTSSRSSLSVYVTVGKWYQQRTLQKTYNQQNKETATFTKKQSTVPVPTHNLKCTWFQGSKWDGVPLHNLRELESTYQATALIVLSKKTCSYDIQN
jgi:hypothetical protein